MRKPRTPQEIREAKYGKQLPSDEEDNYKLGKELDKLNEEVHKIKRDHTLFKEQKDEKLKEVHSKIARLSVQRMRVLKRMGLLS